MNVHWLMRMARWARHPPSGRYMWTVGIVVVAALVLYGLESYGLLPDWISAQRINGRVLR